MIERLLAADAAVDRGELDAAERLFRQIADADPRNAIAVVGLARIAVARADPDAARELAGRALEIDPDEAAAKRLLADLDRPAGRPEPATEPPPVEAAAPTANLPSRAWWRRLLDAVRRHG